MLSAAHNMGGQREEEIGKTTRVLLEKKERLEKVKAKQEEETRR